MSQDSSKRFSWRRVGALLIVLLLAACQAGTSPGETPMETPMEIEPAATPTYAPPTPTTGTPPTVTPTLTPEPTNPPLLTTTNACELGTMLLALKDQVPYEEFALHMNQLSDAATLMIWFVDPALDGYDLSGDLTEGLELARQHAAEVALLLRNGSPCVDTLIDVINPVVVDPEYRGWLAAEVSVDRIPIGTSEDKDLMEMTAERLQPGYLLDTLPAPYQAGSCAWPEARERLQSHFSLTRQNVAFYFVVDLNGPNIWVQWDGPTDPALMLASLLNVQLALDCFSPVANLIFLVVDDAGMVTTVGYVPQMNYNQLQILFER